MKLVTPTSGACEIQLFYQIEEPTPLTTLRGIRDFVYLHTRDKLAAPVDSCTNVPDGDQHIICCMTSSNISADCLAATAMTSPAAMAGLAFNTYSLIGAELAGESIVLPPGSESTLAAGESYFVWRGPYPNGTFDGKNLLATRLSSKLLERLSYVSATLLPKFREAIGSRNIRDNAILCDANGLSVASVDWTAGFGNDFPLFISTGTPAPARRAPGASPVGVTVEMRTEFYGTYLRSTRQISCAPGTQCADGSSNMCLVEGLVELARHRLSPLPCLAAIASSSGNMIAMGTSFKYEPVFQHAEAAAVLANGLYIMGLWTAEGFTR